MFSKSLFVKMRFVTFLILFFSVASMAILDTIVLQEGVDQYTGCFDKGTCTTSDKYVLIVVGRC